jgi:hypothetical protein
MTRKKAFTPFKDKPAIFVHTAKYRIFASPESFSISCNFLQYGQFIMFPPRKRRKTNTKKFYNWLVANKQQIENTVDYHLVYLLLALDKNGIEYTFNGRWYNLFQLDKRQETV